MVAHFMWNTSDERTVPKTLTVRIADVTIDMLDASDIIHPIIKVLSTKVDGQINYVKIDSLGRSYFIRKWTMDQGYVVLELEEDVLETWKEQLLDADVVVNRNEEHHNNYLIDDKAKVLGYKAVRTIKFPSGFDAGVQEFVMGVIGSIQS